MAKPSKGQHAAKEPRYTLDPDSEVRAFWYAQTTFSGRLGVYADIMREALVDVNDDPWEQAFGRGIVGVFQHAQEEYLRAEREYGRPIDIERDAKTMGANVGRTARAVWELALSSMEFQEETA